jgi:hypothetical protein
MFRWFYLSREGFCGRRSNAADSFAKTFIGYLETELRDVQIGVLQPFVIVSSSIHSETSCFNVTQCMLTGRRGQPQERPVGLRPLHPENEAGCL